MQKQTEAFQNVIQQIPRRHRNALMQKVLIVPAETYIGNDAEKAEDKIKKWLEVFNENQTNERINTMHKYSGKNPMSDTEMKALINVSWPFIREFYKLHEYTNPHAYGSFVINYSEGMNKSLNLHTDDSLYTISICLQNTATGTEVVFHRGNEMIPVVQTAGEIMFHLGSHQHQTNQIKDGSRTNIIIWVKADKLSSETNA